MKTEAGRFPAHSRHASLLLSLCVVLLTTVSGTWAHATQVPFTEHIISTAADQAYSVFEADADGDMDVLSPSSVDDKIAWYENNGLWPPSFTERVLALGDGQ